MVSNRPSRPIPPPKARQKAPPDVAFLVLFSYLCTINQPNNPLMKHLLTLLALTLSLPMAARLPRMARAVPLDSIILSDPFILADSATRTYYMTGTGGQLWKSRDLRMWTGPFTVTDIDPASWMGPHPQIWAAEIHPYKGKYYYFATFTNTAVKIDTVRGNVIDRRASQVLVSDRPDGPYRLFGDSTFLPPGRPTLDGTFWVDRDGKPYMVYCGEWLQNWNGTIEKIALKPDLSGTVGESRVLFRAFDSPWSREVDELGRHPNKVTDGPWLFRTGTGRLGMLWTSWVYGDYTMGVAYSESGTLDGPWTQEAWPLTPPNYGHGMLFRDFDGRLLLSLHSHRDTPHGYVRRPALFLCDLSGDRLRILGPLRDDSAAYAVDTTVRSYPGYKLVFHDEFDRDGRPDACWSYEQGFVRNEELQWYQPGNATVSDGRLVIEGRRERVRNPHYRKHSADWRLNRRHASYTSSCLTTQDSFRFRYGRVEVRARIPATQGSWPAIWLLGNREPWPKNGEIDMMEYYIKDGEPSILANACWSDGRPHSPTWNSAVVPFRFFETRDARWKDKYHVWRMDWDERLIRLYLDDELLNEIDLSQTRNAGESRVGNPFSNDIPGFGDYLLLNLAIGGNGGEPDPQAFPMRYEVDYVRVYQKTENEK